MSYDENENDKAHFTEPEVHNQALYDYHDQYPNLDVPKQEESKQQSSPNVS